MDYEATDREMSSWVVTAKKQNTRFFLTAEKSATTILANAKRYRWLDVAEAEAMEETMYDGEAGWNLKWEAMSVPAAYNLAAAGR